MSLKRVTMRKTYLPLFGLLLLALQVQAGMAQESGKPSEPPAMKRVESPGISSTSSALEYRIWPGDVLDVRVFAHPELNGEVAVDERGFIRLPQIAEEIRAACRTTKELREEIVSLYRRQGNYHVYLRVKEYNAPPVNVTGAVRLPTRYQLRRGIRLAEVLALAGGLTETAAGEITLTRAQPSLCGAPGDVNERAARSTVINVKEVMRGDERSNPYLQPGDHVAVTEAGKIYVAGGVRVQSFILMLKPYTLSQAIEAAGGPLPDAKIERISICRQLDGGMQAKELFVNLKDVRAGLVKDMLLEADDIVYVPDPRVRIRINVCVPKKGSPGNLNGSLEKPRIIY